MCSVRYSRRSSAYSESSARSFFSSFSKSFLRSFSKKILWNSFFSSLRALDFYGSLGVIPEAILGFPLEVSPEVALDVLVEVPPEVSLEIPSRVNSSPGSSSSNSS